MIDGIRSNGPWWRLEQRLRQLAQKAAVLRNPRVYSYNQVAMRTSPGGRNKVTDQKEKLRGLNRTLWTSYITENSRRSQDRPSMAFRRRPRWRDSVSKQLARGDLQPLASDWSKPASGTKEKCVAYGLPCERSFGTCFPRP